MYAAAVRLLEDALPSAEAEAFLGDDLVAALIDIDLLATRANECVRAAVDLFPIERVLDLCTGTGVQALCAAARADEVVGVDVNPRAVLFARANACMNGIDNVTFVEGDLCCPVAGRRFDLVIANPPFVAAPPGEQRFYRDGGPLGDGVLLDILAELGDHLAVDGEAYIITEFVRRPDEVDVLAATLGAVDVLIVDLTHYDLRTFISYHAHGALLHGGWVEYAAEVERWLNHAPARGIEMLSYSIVAVRHAPSFRLTRRTMHSEASPPGTSATAQVIDEWRARGDGERPAPSPSIGE